MNGSNINTINSGFVGDFKLGDNINYNLEILRVLYVKDSEEKNHLLNKPVTLIIISIIEGLLRDFFFKAINYTNEGIPNIREEILTDIRKKKIHKFYAFIAAAREHNVFNIGDQYLYDDLDTLRKLRNRIHIQNEKNEFERDEDHAFSTDRKILAEKTLERIMRLMSDKHNRGQVYVEDFSLPWRPHYK